MPHQRDGSREDQQGNTEAAKGWQRGSGAKSQSRRLNGGGRRWVRKHPQQQNTPLKPKATAAYAFGGKKAGSGGRGAAVRAEARAARVLESAGGAELRGRGETATALGAELPGRHLGAAGRAVDKAAGRTLSRGGRLGCLGRLPLGCHSLGEGLGHAETGAHASAGHHRATAFAATALGHALTGADHRLARRHAREIAPGEAGVAGIVGVLLVEFELLLGGFRLGLGDADGGDPRLALGRADLPLGRLEGFFVFLGEVDVEVGDLKKAHADGFEVRRVLLKGPGELLLKGHELKQALLLADANLADDGFHRGQEAILDPSGDLLVALGLAHADVVHDEPGRIDDLEGKLAKDPRGHHLPKHRVFHEPELAPEALIVEGAHRDEVEIGDEDVAAGHRIDELPENRNILGVEGVALARAGAPEGGDDTAVAEEYRRLVRVHRELRPHGDRLLGMLVDDQIFLLIRSVDEHLLDAILDEVEHATEHHWDHSFAPIPQIGVETPSYEGMATIERDKHFCRAVHEGMATIERDKHFCRAVVCPQVNTQLSGVRIPTRFLLIFVGFLSLGLLSTSAKAQDAGLDPLQELFGDSELVDVPRPTEEPVPTPVERPEEAPLPPVRRGPVVEALPGLRVSRQELLLEFPEGPEGFADAEVRLLFVSRAAHPGDVRFRLPLPPGSHPYSLELCQEEQCRSGDHQDLRGLPEGAEGLPEGSEEQQPRGALYLDEDLALLEAGPVTPGEPLELRFRVLVPTRTRGGVERLLWPAMEADDRTVPWEVRLTARAHFDVSLQGRPQLEGELWPGQTLEVQGIPRSPRAGLWLSRLPCDEGQCTVLRASGGPIVQRPRRLLVLIDASPSTHGPTQGRQAQALTALLQHAPPGSSLRAFAFATESRPVIGAAQVVEDVAVASLLEARQWDLGSTTRLDHALEASAPERGEDIVILGDGELSSTPGLTAALTRLRQRRIPVHVLNLGDGPTASSLQQATARSGGVLQHQGLMRGSAPMAQLVAPIFANTTLSMLSITTSDGQRQVRVRGGEELRLERSGPLSIQGERPSSPPRELLGKLRQSLLFRGASIAVAGNPGTDVVRLDALEPRTEPAQAEATSFPEESVLQMLRRQLVPAARRCLRADRRGRLDYAISARFALELRNQEVHSHRVEGQLPEPLRECLFEAVGALDIPRFSGTIRVHYPIHTDRHAPRPSVELAGDVARGIDAELSTPSDDFSLLE